MEKTNKQKNMIIAKTKTYVSAHKAISAIAALVIIILGYWGFKHVTSASAETRYVTATAQNATIITAVTATGQVSSLTQIDLKPKASGDITYIGVTPGQSVKAGALIAKLDTTSAEKSVRDAQASLDSEKIAYQKLVQPADELSLTQAEDALAESQQTEQQAEDSLAKDYDDAFTAISNAFLDLPTSISGVQDTLYKINANGQDNISYYANLVQDYAPTVTTYEANAADAYKTARVAYDQNFLDYKAVNRDSSTTTVENLLNETYATTRAISTAVKSSSDLFSFVKDQITANNKNIPPTLATYQTNLNSYTNTTNTNITDLLNSINAIKNDKNSIINDKLSVDEKNQSLIKLKAGADPLDLQSEQVSMTQRQNALLDAQQNLDDYYVTAPFDGIVASVAGKLNDSASSGTAIATLITTQKIATVSLNEIDAAKIQLGQKATLTFDAISGLSIAGTVSEIDSLGTVSQGVVTYSVQIAFDTQDNRIKSGMSVSAAIIIASKQDVLTVPNSAIKAQGNTSYVEVFDPPLVGSSSVQGAASSVAPQMKEVQTGVSNTTLTEIVSGLTAGDQVVTRTIAASTGTTATAAPASATSLLGGGRAGGFTGGGAVRAGR